MQLATVQYLHTLDIRFGHTFIDH